MQSSTSVACRVGVMLICLLAIPLAAMFGTKLPGLVRQWLDRGQVSTSPASESVPSVAPPFRGSDATAFPTNAEAPLWGGVPAGLAATVEPGQSPQVAPRTDLRTDPPPSHYLGARTASCPGLVPVSMDLRKDPAAISPAVFASDGSPLVGVAPAEWRESSAQMPRERVSAEVPGPSSDRGAASPSFVETPETRELQRQLRQWGASYYALETWGAQGDFYRFYARMAAGGGAGYVRHFEATDRDPLQAMASVLEQVERWRADQEVPGPAAPP